MKRLQPTRRAPPILCAVATVLSIALPIQASDSLHREDTLQKIEGFWETYCLRCHGAEKQKGGFRLDQLALEFENPLAAEKWGEVAFRIKSAEMPPPEESQPSAEEIGELVDFLTERIRESAAARMANRGRIESYRLSREEYAHTVYDLLGVVYDVEAPGAFNEDPNWHGIRRVGALLSLSPSHVERYLQAADTIIASAFPDKETPPVSERKIVGKSKRQLLQLGEGWRFRLERPGHYKLRIHASGLPAFTGRTPRLSVWHEYHQRSYGGTDLVAAEDAPTTVEFDGLFPAGNYSIRNHARTLKHANGGISIFRNETISANSPLASLTGRHRSRWTKVVDENGQPTVPTLLVDWIEIEGPLLTERTQVKRRNVIPAEIENATAQRNSLRGFAERAWRRPVTELEIEPYVALIASERAAGAPIRAAYRAALTGILVSRGFFNLVEGSPNEDRRQLTGFELASRLSFFLWSSMPDAFLFQAARDGALNSRDGLARQIDRMIEDPKIERFLDSFPRQWLQLDRVGMFQPDPELYPEYDPWLEESMVEETLRYFSEMFHRNLPLREIVDSNWTILNPRLANHYGMPWPKKTGFHRVSFENPQERGGILTHASVLSLTSDGTRHRPVHRGVWVSETILAQTPTPPPPNIDPLEPVTGVQPKTTIRSKLEAHATDPNCVSCHAKIDPLGLAFENYDAIGRWRETERVIGGVGADPVVDASGQLPDGKSFDEANDFKRLLAEDDTALARAFLERLATYALRRTLTIDDKDELERIAQSSQVEHPRLQELIREFVLSDLFRRR